MEEIIGGIVREYLEFSEDVFERDLKIEIVDGKATSIVGPRRAGKTYYLLGLMQKLKHEGKNVVFFSFDDDRIYPPTLDTFRTLIRIANTLYPRGKIYYLLDEVQEVDRWELAVKRIVEKERNFAVLTGSSSKLLSKEIATQLRGRTISYELFPFSFTEVLKVKKFKIDKYPTEREISYVKDVLKEIMIYGSFPEIVLKSVERDKILKEYLEVMIFRDIIERWNIRNMKAVRLFLNLALNSFSCKFSINKAANYMKSLGIKVSKNVLYDYMEYFRDAYIVFPLRRFSYSLKEVEQSIPKVYAIDNGILKIVSHTLSENIGKLMENLVFLHIRRKYGENEIFYFQTRDGYEVDFVIKKNGKIEKLMQVTYACSFDEIDRREYRSLLVASEVFKTDKPDLIIVTWDYEDKKEVSWFGKKGVVKFIPLWRYLLCDV